jgi:hypothetical protein
MTIREAAEAVLGDATYDAALPQDWVDAVVEKTGHSYDNVLANFVWAYDEQAPTFGRPCALTGKGNLILTDANFRMGTNYPLTPKPPR